jgi:hypothetical protein
LAVAPRIGECVMTADQAVGPVGTIEEGTTWECWTDE